MGASDAARDAAVDAVNEQASTLVRRGLGLLEARGSGAAAGALECFDRALALRLTLPVSQSPGLQYDLAGTWLNRAAVLVSDGGATGLAAAMVAYDAALALLSAIPLDADPRFPRRLAIAHQNRGRALQAHGAASAPAAVQAFNAAIGVLDQAAGHYIEDRPCLQATAWVSLADVEVMDGSEPSCRRAIAAARHALTLVHATERDNAEAAAVGLHARHVCCRALARCLPPHRNPASVSIDDVHLATDAADDGLMLARHWEARGVTQFHAVANDLFQFGAGVYARYQPHFLQEFIVDYQPVSDR